MEVFTGLKPPPLIFRPIPLERFKKLEALNEARTELTNVIALQEALRQLYKDVAELNTMLRPCGQILQNARINVLPLNTMISDYVMIRAHTRKEHKLKTKRRDSMRVKEAKWSLVFVSEDLVNAKLINVHV